VNNRDCRRLAQVFTCVNGQCQAPNVQCARNADCADGASCVFGFCAPIRSPECVRDADCGPGELCDAERCVLAP
jgi:peptidoglycan-associated lipoprotein